MLSQLLLKRRSLFHHYKLLHRHKISARLQARADEDPLSCKLSDLSQEWTSEELQQIMGNINTSGIDILMIFDAIDEAEDDRMVSFVESLVSRPGSSIKAILLSRPTDAFDSPFWKDHRVTLQDENSIDIRIIVWHGLSKLQSIRNGQYTESGSKPPAQSNYLTSSSMKFKTHAALRQTPNQNAQPAAASFISRQQGNSLDLDFLGKKIRERAAGVILWVVLVFDSVFKFAKREPLAKLEDLMSCIAELPRDINDFYSQMIKDLTDTMSDPALRTARKALMWINTASQFRAFTMEELWDALAASSDELNDSSSGRALVDGRIEIQSWKDFNRILRRLCGSLIEVLPHKSATSTQISDKYKDADSRAISGECVVQLMHQTVKDFLALPAAGVFQFTEESARGEALHGCQIFMRSTLPDEIDSIISLPKDQPHAWVFFSASMARHLEELRLFPLCLQLFNSFPESMGALQAQLDMKWYALLPRWFHDYYHLPLVQRRQYIPVELTLTSSALCLMFQFISRRGLRHAARNLMSILDMGRTAEFWPQYRDVILDSLAFTVFDLEDLEDSSASNALRFRLLTRGGVRQESANLALDNHCYETTICKHLIDDQERDVKISLQYAVQTMELIANHEALRL